MDMEPERWLISSRPVKPTSSVFFMELVKASTNAQLCGTGGAGKTEACVTEPEKLVEMVGGCGQSLAMDLNSGQLLAIFLRATNFWLILQTKLAIYPPILAPTSTSSTTVFNFFFFSFSCLISS